VLPSRFWRWETAPRNYQAWIATPEATEDFIRQLRHATGRRSDRKRRYASGGQPQFQEQVCARFPRVEIAHARPDGSPARKHSLSLGYSPTTHPKRPQAPCAWAKPESKRQELAEYPTLHRGAPLTRDNTRPDISRADSHGA